MYICVCWVHLKGEHEVRPVERIKKVHCFAKDIYIHTYINMLNTKGVCRRYFSVGMTQFEYRSLHSQMASAVLIYHNQRGYQALIWDRLLLETSHVFRYLSLLYCKYTVSYSIKNLLSFLICTVAVNANSTLSPPSVVHYRPYSVSVQNPVTGRLLFSDIFSTDRQIPTSNDIWEFKTLVTMYQLMLFI